MSIPKKIIDKIAAIIGVALGTVKNAIAINNKNNNNPGIKNSIFLYSIF